MKVLLTGGRGFVGRQTIAPLLERGYEVHAITRQAGGSESHGVLWHNIDFLNSAAVGKLIEEVRPSHWLHLAWITEHGAYWASSENLKWVAASLQTLIDFIAHGGQRVVMTGSCAEYEWGGSHKLREDSSTSQPATLYGQCKKSLHDMAAMYCNQNSTSFAWARLFFLYGPHEDKRRLVASAIHQLLQDSTFECTDGTQLRDFLHSSDAADAIVTLLASSVQGAVNIGSGESTSLIDVLNKIGELTENAEFIKAGAIPMRDNEPPIVVAETQRLNLELEWQPRYTLDTGLQATIDWWKHQLTQ